MNASAFSSFSLTSVHFQQERGSKICETKVDNMIPELWFPGSPEQLES